MRIIRPKKKPGIGCTSVEAFVDDSNTNADTEICDSGKTEADLTQAWSGGNIKPEILDSIAPGKKRRRSELAASTVGHSNELEIDPVKKEFNNLLATGVRLLAMREHSVKEITNKLKDKAITPDLLHAVVDELLAKKYLSDERFTESYVRSRRNRGFGPVKIKAELKVKGISNTLIQDYLEEGSALWIDIAEAQYRKKFGLTPVIDYRDWTKRARFLQNKGFTGEQIQSTLPDFSAD